MEKKKFDVIVIGSGPGGYVAAIKAAQTGKSVALIEKKFLGGTCLNVGCIPTKTLLSSADVLTQVKRASEFGIQTGPISVAYDQMKKRKDSVVESIRKNLEGLIKANKITILSGHAKFTALKEIKVQGKDSLFLEAEKFILATGSIPVDVKAFPADHKRILDSSSILELTEIPKSLTIVGGGYIGCEFASLFSELGSKVTIVEALPSILALQGHTVASVMTKAFEKKGITLKTNSFVKSIQNTGKETKVTLSEGEELLSEYTLVSIGRAPYTKDLGLEKVGLKGTDRGFIEVNDRMETDVDGIYAIGDVTGKAMLAHVASHQGIIAALNATGQRALAHYHAVPAVIFTSPEVATVGMTIEEAKEKGRSIIEGTFPFMAIGKAQASKDAEGFAQIIADKGTHAILGATVIGHDAANLIAEMALAIQNELTLECVAETIHAHPTLAEIWHETASMALNSPIHLPKKR